MDVGHLGMHGWTNAGQRLQRHVPALASAPGYETDLATPLYRSQRLLGSHPSLTPLALQAVAMPSIGWMRWTLPTDP